MKGFTVDVFRAEYFSSLNVIPQDAARVLLIGEDVPEINDSTGYNVVKLVKRELNGEEYLHVEPIEPGSYAFGGSFIHSSDSRFPTKYPIPVHDRDMNKEDSTC